MGAPEERRTTTPGCQHEVRVRASSHTACSERHRLKHSHIPHDIIPLRGTQTRARARTRTCACSARVASSTTTAHISTTPHEPRLTLSTEQLYRPSPKALLHTLRVHHPPLHDTMYTHTLAQTHTRTTYHATMYLHILHLLFTAQHTAQHSQPLTPAIRRFLIFQNWFFLDHFFAGAATHLSESEPQVRVLCPLLPPLHLVMPADGAGFTTNDP